MSRGEKKNRLLGFFGFGEDDGYEDDEEYFEEEEYEVPTRNYRDDNSEYEKKRRKPKVVPVQERNARSSVVIYSPKTYNDAQPLVTQLIQHKHVIVKLDKVEKRIGQRILDFMSGAAYAADAQVTEVSKGSIYLFASNQTFIDKAEEMESPKGSDGYTLDDDEF